MRSREKSQGEEEDASRVGGQTQVMMNSQVHPDQRRAKSGLVMKVIGAKEV